jgi:hypothetical protein
VISPWYVFLVGLGGGIVNSLLLERNSLILPAVRRERGTLRVELGFVSNVALGVVAAFLPYLFGISQLTHRQQVGVSLLAAIGGASFISGFVQRRQIAIRAAKADALDEITQIVLGIPRRGSTDGKGPVES